MYVIFSKTWSVDDKSVSLFVTYWWRSQYSCVMQLPRCRRESRRLVGRCEGTWKHSCPCVWILTSA